MLVTVKDILPFLNFCPGTHVSIRKYDSKCGFFYLGGGDIEKVVNRFGDMRISYSYIYDGILVIYVD